MLRHSLLVALMCFAMCGVLGARTAVEVVEDADAEVEGMMALFGHTGESVFVEGVDRDHRGREVHARVKAGVAEAQITYVDVEKRTGFGFDDQVLGSTRRACWEATVQYVLDLVGSYRSTLPLRIEVRQSEYSTKSVLATMGAYSYTSQPFYKNLVYETLVEGHSYSGFHAYTTWNFYRDYFTPSECLDVVGSFANDSMAMLPPNTDENSPDFISVALHEITHALGFLGGASYSNIRCSGGDVNPPGRSGTRTYFGSCSSPPAAANWFASMIAQHDSYSSDFHEFNIFSNKTTTRGALVPDPLRDPYAYYMYSSMAVGENAYLSGPHVMAHNEMKSGELLHTPSSYSSSSVAHFAASCIDFGMPCVMRSQASNGETQRHYNGMERAVLRDFGYPVDDCVPFMCSRAKLARLGINLLHVGDALAANSFGTSIWGRPSCATGTTFASEVWFHFETPDRASYRFSPQCSGSSGGEYNAFQSVLEVYESCHVAPSAIACGEFTSSCGSGVEVKMTAGEMVRIRMVLPPQPDVSSGALLITVSEERKSFVPPGAPRAAAAQPCDAVSSSAAGTYLQYDSGAQWGYSYGWSARRLYVKQLEACAFPLTITAFDLGLSPSVREGARLRLFVWVDEAGAGSSSPTSWTWVFQMTTAVVKPGSISTYTPANPATIDIDSGSVYVGFWVDDSSPYVLLQSAAPLLEPPREFVSYATLDATSTSTNPLDLANGLFVASGINILVRLTVELPEPCSLVRGVRVTDAFGGEVALGSSGPHSYGVVGSRSHNVRIDVDLAAGASCCGGASYLTSVLSAPIGRPQVVSVTAGASGCANEKYDIYLTRYSQGCTITAVRDGGVAECSTRAEFHSHWVQVAFSNAPAYGQLIVGGQGFVVEASPQWVLLQNLPNDYEWHSLDIYFAQECSCRSQLWIWTPKKGGCKSSAQPAAMN